MTYTINFEAFKKRFDAEYDYLYQRNDDVIGFEEAVSAFDDALENNENFKNFVSKFCDYRQDSITSDREAGAFVFALQALTEEGE